MQNNSKRIGTDTTSSYQLANGLIVTVINICPSCVSANQAVWSGHEEIRRRAEEQLYDIFANHR